MTDAPVEAGAEGAVCSVDGRTGPDHPVKASTGTGAPPQTTLGVPSQPVAADGGAAISPPPSTTSAVSEPRTSVTERQNGDVRVHAVPPPTPFA